MTLKNSSTVVSLNEVVDAVTAIRAGKLGAQSSHAIGNKLYCSCDGAVCGCDGNHCPCNVVSGGTVHEHGNAADFEVVRRAQFAALKKRLDAAAALDDAE